MTLRGGSLRREPGTHRLDRNARSLDRYSKPRAKRTSASALFRAGVAEVRNARKARKASYLRLPRTRLGSEAEGGKLGTGRPHCALGDPGLSGRRGGRALDRPGDAA